MEQLYAGIALFVLFLLVDVILYTFKSAVDNINESEIEKKAEEGNIKAVRLKKRLNSFSKFGDTLDIVVFITNLVSGAYILNVIRSVINRKMENESVWVPFIVGTIMLIVLVVFGVLIPKKCGKRNAEKSAMNLCGFVNGVIVMLTPVTGAVTLVSHLILRIFGINPNENKENVTEEEIITMVNEGQEQGVLEASEAEMITNIFELGDKNAGDIMTHRSSIVALDCHMTLEEVIQSQKDGNYSRFPVFDGDIDNITGTLHIRDALILYSNIPNRKKQIAKLKGLMRPAYFVPESRNIDDLLKEMQSEKVHMGIVVDEYGQTAGVISMEDIIEEIVGNILDEYDDEETEIELSEDDTYVVDGLTRLEDLDKLLGVEIRSDEFDTLNGFLISRLHRIPEENETETVNEFGFIFTILEVSQNVVRKVEIKKESKEENEDDKSLES
ncbi:MAG: hemolysin family protein [Butyrivibrio sp.]